MIQIAPKEPKVTRVFFVLGLISIQSVNVIENRPLVLVVVLTDT